MSHTVAPRKSAIDRFLNIVERGGKALPHPATLFALLAAIVVLLSGIAAYFEISAPHPATGETIKVVNLLSLEGLHRISTSMVTNFTSFAPLGTVLVALLGIGVAEHSGLIGAALRLLVLSSPRYLLTPVMVFAGVMSNARIIDADYTVTPVANWYFMIASTPVVTLLGWFVTERIVAPRFPDGPTRNPEESGEQTPEQDPEAQKLKPEEWRGLKWATWSGLLLTLLLIWAALPQGVFWGAGFMRDPGTGDLLRSPLLNSVVAIIFLYGVITGVIYGAVAGTVKNDSDVIKGMGQSMSTLGVYLVLTFFAAQFVAYFNWTNLGLIMGGFILLTAVANLFMGSASAKWALMAPIFVPMFMILGYSPELTQIAYRIGDSVTNIISPMMSYFALIIAFLQRYEPKAGIGTVISVMLPYSVVFALGWTALFVVWLAFDLPIGPGAPLQYIPAATGGG